MKSQIESVKAIYDKGFALWSMFVCIMLIYCIHTESEVDLSNYDCNTVASLLKLYLRELPEPLIPLKLLPRLESASRESLCLVCHSLIKE